MVLLWHDHHLESTFTPIPTSLTSLFVSSYFYIKPQLVCSKSQFEIKTSPIITPFSINIMISNMFMMTTRATWFCCSAMNMLMFQTSRTSATNTVIFLVHFNTTTVTFHVCSCFTLSKHSAVGQPHPHLQNPPPHCKRSSWSCHCFKNMWQW